MAHYCYAGAQQVAVRHSNSRGTEGLVCVVSDHGVCAGANTGSTSKTVDPLSNAYTNKPNVLTENRN